MPVVPFSPTPAPAEPSAPAPDPTFMDMAAAMVKRDYAQKISDQSRTWEYDSSKNNSWSGPSSQPDGQVYEYKGDKSGFEASSEIADEMRAGKYKPGDIVKVPNSDGDSYFQYHPQFKDSDWPFLPVRKRKPQEDLIS